MARAFGILCRHDQSFPGFCSSQGREGTWPRQNGDSAETQRLLAQIRSGAANAVDRLLERHRPYLLRLVQVRLDPRIRARVDPSDVVQEAQIEAVRRLDDYLERPSLPFRLWLRHIAQDRLLMLRRRHVEACRQPT